MESMKNEWRGTRRHKRCTIFSDVNLSHGFTLQAMSSNTQGPDRRSTEWAAAYSSSLPPALPLSPVPPSLLSSYPPFFTPFYPLALLQSRPPGPAPSRCFLSSLPLLFLFLSPSVPPSLPTSLPPFLLFFCHHPSSLPSRRSRLLSCLPPLPPYPIPFSPLMEYFLPLSLTPSRP